jgi:hypothetical protein
METYGLVIERDGKYTISGDGFIESSPTSYQILRSTNFSLLWKNNISYTLYFVKYPVKSTNYLQFAHECRKTNTWGQYIIATFYLSYDLNHTDIQRKILTVASVDNLWRMTLNVYKYDNNPNEYIISLPYISKNTVYNT